LSLIAETDELEHRLDLPPGDYFCGVSAVDAIGFESATGEIRFTCKEQ